MFINLLVATGLWRRNQNPEPEPEIWVPVPQLGLPDHLKFFQGHFFQ